MSESSFVLRFASVLRQILGLGFLTSESLSAESSLKPGNPAFPDHIMVFLCVIRRVYG